MTEPDADLAALARDLEAVAAPDAEGFDIDLATLAQALRGAVDPDAQEFDAEAMWDSLLVRLDQEVTPPPAAPEAPPPAP